MAVRSPRWLLLIALGIAAAPTLSIALREMILSSGVPHADVHLQETRKLTAPCTDLFPPDARSLFLGQVSYDEPFLGAYPVLYLMRPDLRPATPFISDELGVQNSCALGSRIAADLIRTRRPLVVVLNTKTFSDPINNPTRNVTSCGKIEAIMASMPAITLGTCRLADHLIYRVMVVR